MNQTISKIIAIIIGLLFIGIGAFALINGNQLAKKNFQIIDLKIPFFIAK